MASTETKAIHVVPVPSKGTASLKQITEEVVRFALENAGRENCIFQADSERATRQILRSVQQVRKVLGLQTEIRLTGAGQRASNGLVERAVQTSEEVTEDFCRGARKTFYPRRQPPVSLVLQARILPHQQVSSIGRHWGNKLRVSDRVPRKTGPVRRGGYVQEDDLSQRLECVRTGHLVWKTRVQCLSHHSHTRRSV